MPATVRHHTGQELHPDPDRVVTRLFLPSSEPPHIHRSRDVITRVLALEDATVRRERDALLERFGDRHQNLQASLAANADAVLGTDTVITADRRLLVGAAFTCEYAVEGAALCNPGVVLHPDQQGLRGGQVRVAVSLRGIGEGHTSCLQFASAVLEGAEWRFEPRPVPLHAGQPAPGTIPLPLFSALVHAGREPDELTLAVLNSVPAGVLGIHIETVLADLHHDLLLHPEAHRRVATQRRWAGAVYTTTFPEDTQLEQRVLMPATPDESHGLEDARFTWFTDDDHQCTYRACYTAYDGADVSNRVLVSTDLRTFASYPLTGPGAANKGMALFPRTIRGRHVALSRADGTTIGITTSEDGYRWDTPTVIDAPTEPWQIMHVGNASPPIETAAGWLVLTHGLGLLRTYSLGALLLDRDDPTRVLGKLRRPLLDANVHAGYVPNVVFSCGAILHGDTLFIPYGVGDSSVALASVTLRELLEDMAPSSQ
jgi:predicted GH43/DUF377 family glycosyl hydrolase